MTCAVLSGTDRVQFAHFPFSLIGGTNLRVCHVELQGDGKFEITQAKYKLTEEQKQQEGEKLFDFCAECLSKLSSFHLPFISDRSAFTWLYLRLDRREIPGSSMINTWTMMVTCC